jgi:hypothetical protein
MGIRSRGQWHPASTRLDQPRLPRAANIYTGKLSGATPFVLDAAQGIGWGNATRVTVPEPRF